MSYIKPQDQVQDNVTDRAPTQNAVYDAIAAAVPNPTVPADADKVLSVNSSGVKSWNYAGLGAGSFGAGNTVVGRSKPVSLTGVENSLLGSAVGDSLSTGFRNVLLGVYAGGGITSGQGNIAIGYAAGYTSGYALLDTGIRNVLIGLSASTAAAGTNDSVAIGYSAVSALNGVSMGSESARYMTGNNNVSVGYQAMLGSAGSSSGANNVSVGYRAGAAITAGTTNVFIGHTAGDAVTSGSNNVIIGDIAGTATLSDTTIIAAGTAQHVKIDSTNVLIGRNAGNSLTTAANAVLIGEGAGSTLTGGPLAICIGQGSSTHPTTYAGIAIGAGSSVPANGYADVAIGWISVSDTNCVAIGAGAIAKTNSTTVGYEAGAGGTNKTNSTLVGYRAANTISQTDIIAIGDRAASDAPNNPTGNNNIYLGNQSKVEAYITTFGQNVSNKMVIGSGAMPISDIVIGKGGTSLTNSNLAAVRITPTPSTGTNEAATNSVLKLSGAQGRGTGIGGDIVLETAPAGSSGSSLNAHVERMKVTAAGDVKILTGDLSVDTAGKGLAIKSGTNAKIGTAQFTAQQTVTVNTTAVTANSLIFVTGQDGVDNYAVQNKVAGTSFEIHHNGGNVTALVAWMIVEATP